MAGRFSQSDRDYMQKALQLAERVKGTTCPNPAVGAVVVKNNIIVGTGATEACGGMHAEKKALKRAGSLSRNATLYVTLEPCCHFGRTPPCTQTIIDAKVGRVVVAVKDPNPLVNGKGIRLLRRNTITVSLGLMRKEAERLNEDFFWHIRHKAPWVSVKLAMTLDGRIADRRGASKWITGKKSRTFVHGIRRSHAAIAVGSGTYIYDKPRLTVRHVRGTSPVPMVFSSDATLSVETLLPDNKKQTRAIIVCSGGRAGHKDVRDDGVAVWYTGKRNGVQNLRAFLTMAYLEGISSILIEGGGKLASSFLEHKLVNRLYLFFGNKILGQGLEGLSFTRGLPITRCLKLAHIESQNFDEDTMVTGIPCWEE